MFFYFSVCSQFIYCEQNKTRKNIKSNYEYLKKPRTELKLWIAETEMKLQY